MVGCHFNRTIISKQFGSEPIDTWEKNYRYNAATGTTQTRGMVTYSIMILLEGPVLLLP